MCIPLWKNIWTVIRGGFITYLMGHTNPWSLHQTRYFMYIFARIDLILSVGTHALKKLNGALGWVLSFLPRRAEINSHLILSLVVHPCYKNPRSASGPDTSLTKKNEMHLNRAEWIHWMIHSRLQLIETVDSLSCLREKFKLKALSEESFLWRTSKSFNIGWTKGTLEIVYWNWLL